LDYRDYRSACPHLSIRGRGGGGGEAQRVQLHPRDARNRREGQSRPFRSRRSTDRPLDARRVAEGGRRVGSRSRGRRASNSVSFTAASSRETCDRAINLIRSYSRPHPLAFPSMPRGGMGASRGSPKTLASLSLSRNDLGHSSEIEENLPQIIFLIPEGLHCTRVTLPSSPSSLPCFSK